MTTKNKGVIMTNNSSIKNDFFSDDVVRTSIILLTLTLIGTSVFLLS